MSSFKFAVILATWTLLKEMDCMYLHSVYKIHVIVFMCVFFKKNVQHLIAGEF